MNGSVLDSTKWPVINRSKEKIFDNEKVLKKMNI